MALYPPNIEIIPNTQSLPPNLQLKPWYRSSRFIIFLVVFLICAVTSLIYVYSRPAIYRSSATVLTSAMTAIDQEISTTDVQHVAIQQQILLSHELLAETLSKLSSIPISHPSLLTLSAIQNMLKVVTVPDTNLVEIQAEGTNPEFLPLLINTWIDVYLDARKGEVEKLTDDTTRLVEDELKGLEVKVEAKRIELEKFRKNNDILSTGRDENEALARLKGLNDSLNRASEEEVKAKANLDAVKFAISENQPVVPQQDQGILQDLEKRRQELIEKQAKLAERYTQDYIDLQPTLKIIPKEIVKIEKEINKTLIYGKNIVLTEAKKNYAASQQTIKSIREQMAKHKQQTAEFTTQFAKYETLKTDLEGLEKLQRETQERLVQIQTSYKDKYPQVTVINRAFQPDAPIRPRYHRDALIALTGSLLLGLFIVWASDYLTKKQEQPAASVTLSGIHLYQSAHDQLNHRQANVANPTLEHSHKNLPVSSLARELTCYELERLLNNANLKGKQLISLILSGLTVDEIFALTSEQIDLNANTITLKLPSPRSLPLYSAVKTLLEQSGDRLAWESEKAITVNELQASLFYAAVDAGLPNPEDISADAIRHSYIAYLVRQGLRLSDLESIIGHLEPSVMFSYSTYSPPQRGLSVEQIEPMHPALFCVIA